VLKREKRKKHLYGHQPKLQNMKMEVREEEVRLPSRKPLKNMVASNLPLEITKMPFCHSKLQKCHYGLKMLAQ